MSRFTVRTSLTAIAATTFALVGLTGCTTTSYSCSGGSCTVTLTGAGASTDIDHFGGSVETTVALDGVNGGTATFSIDNEEGTCAAGESLTVADLQVTCTEVGEDELTMEVTA